MQPCVDMFVELEVPENTFFVLDRSQLDSDKVLAGDLSSIPTGPTFILDESRLDSAEDLLEGSGAVQPGYVWRDFTSETMNCTIDRGVDMTQSVAARPTAGEFTAAILDPGLNALAEQNVGVGTQMRLRVGNQAVFQGETTSLSVEYDAQGVPTAYLTATDAVARLNSVQMDPRPAESYLSRVIASADAADVQVNAATRASVEGQSLEPTVYADTALRTLVDAQDSEGSLVFIDRNNVMHALTRGEEQQGSDDVSWVFSNDHGVARTDHTCLSAFVVAMNTEQVINNIVFQNTVQNGFDDDGEPVFETLEYTFTAEQSQRYYGIGTLYVQTSLPVDALPEYAQHIFDGYSEAKRKVQSLAFPVDDFKQPGVPDECFIDVGDWTEVVLRDPAGTQLPLLTSKQRVAQVSHNISPDQWDCQVTLL